MELPSVTSSHEKSKRLSFFDLICKVAKRLIPLINSECFFNGRSFKQRAAKQPHCTTPLLQKSSTAVHYFFWGSTSSHTFITANNCALSWIISLHSQMQNCSGLHCVKKVSLKALPLIPRERAQGEVKLYVWPKSAIQSM